jgi:hypothetical protein
VQSLTISVSPTLAKEYALTNGFFAASLTLVWQARYNCLRDETNASS